MPIPDDAGSRQIVIKQAPLRWRIASHFVVPLLLWVFVWSTAAFPTSGPQLRRAGILFLALYLPGKLLTILVHKENGVLREHTRVVIAAAALLGLGWAVVALVGIATVGFTALPGLVVFGYAVVLLWGHLRGEPLE